MTGSGQRMRRFFGSTKGLLLVVTTWEALSVAFLSIFSGPMANLGLPTQLGLPAGEVERVGRIIMVYRQPGQEVGWTLPLIDIGIGLFFIAMVIFVGERLIHSSIEGVK